jgi:hypothetical protein
MRTGQSHAALLDNSPRLQRVLTLLQEGPKTTRELARMADVCAVNSIVSELRRNGCLIACAAVDGRKGIYLYTLIFCPVKEGLCLTA